MAITDTAAVLIEDQPFHYIEWVPIIAGAVLRRWAWCCRRSLAHLALRSAPHLGLGDTARVSIFRLLQSLASVSWGQRASPGQPPPGLYKQYA